MKHFIPLASLVLFCTVPFLKATAAGAQGSKRAADDAFSLTFSGTQYASADGVHDFSEEGTLEFWFRRDSGWWDFFYAPVFSIEGTDGNNALLIEARGANVRFQIDTGGGVQEAAIDADLGEIWHHLAVSFSDQGTKMYLDGVFTASNAAGPVLPDPLNLRFGLPISGALFSFGGEIASARLWSLERSEEEIRINRFGILEVGHGLLCAWPINEGSGQTAFDIGPLEIPLLLGDTAAVEEDADPVWTPLEGLASISISGLSSNEGPREGGETISIYGSGFSTGNPPAVMFGTQSSPSVAVVDPTELAVVVPANDAYSIVDVTIDTGEETAVLAEAYSYIPAFVIPLVEEGDSWHYFTNQFGPSQQWKTLDFDPDANNWSTGPTGIGYGDDDDATVVDQMQTEGYLTLYARITWPLPADPSQIDFLRLQVRYDDGFVAYLNGSEVCRRNVEPDIPSFDDAASALHEITGGAGTFDEAFDLVDRRDLLHHGENILAIEVHNAAPDSSDLSLSAELHCNAIGVSFIRGDVNRNGTLSISDAIAILFYCFMDKEIPCDEAADINNDDNITISDAILMLAFLFNNGPVPPPPYPLAGPDQDDDQLGCDG